MDLIKDIVDVEIENVTGNTNTTDLNTILILAKHTNFTAPELYRVYSDAKSVADDGFAEESYVYKAIALAYRQKRKPRQIVVGAGVAQDGDYVAMFEKMLMIKQGWLWLVSDLREEAEQVKLAQAVQTEDKFYCAGTSNADALDAGKETDIGSLLKTRNLGQTYAWYDAVDEDLVTYSATEIALLARCAGNTAGTVQFLHKELVDVPAPATIDTKTKVTTLLAKGYTHSGTVNGKDYSAGSARFADGSHIDISLSIMWLKTSIREDIFNLLSSVDTLGMDNNGASSVESRVRNKLSVGQDIGIISRDHPIFVTVPDVSKLTPAERATRKLPRVEFSCVLRGAITSVEVRGKVTE